MRKVTVQLAVLAALVPVAVVLSCTRPAAAQTSRCTPNGSGQLICRSQQNAGIGGWINYLSARKSAELKKQVGQMVANGDCDGAQAAALRAGDFGLAKSAKELCTPNPQADR